MNRAPRSGVAFGLVSALLFGLSTPLAKALLGAVDPWMLAGLLYLGSGVGLFVYRLLMRSGAAPEAPLQRNDLPWLGAAIFAGGVVGPVLLMFGLAATSASAGALLLNLEAVATMTIAWFVFRESFDNRILLGALAIVGGSVLLSWQGVGRFDWGALAIAGACLAWGVDNNLTRKVSAADPVQIAMLKGLIAGAVNLALALALGAQPPPAIAVLGAALLGLFGYGVSLVCFVMALRELGAARTSAYFSAAPFVGALAGVVMFRDPLSLQLLAASALMLAGVYLHATERHEHTHTHEPMEHEHAHVHDEHHQHEHAAGDPPGEPHTHRHSHACLVHSHPHFPDLHHRHDHA